MVPLGQAIMRYILANMGVYSMKTLKGYLKGLLLLVFLICLSVPIEVSAASTEDIQKDGSLPGDHYYFISSSTYVYKSHDGKCGKVQNVKDLAKELKVLYYQKFISEGTDSKRFSDTSQLLGDIRYTSTNVSPITNTEISSICESASTVLEVKQGSKTYKFYIPSRTYTVTETYKDSKGKEKQKTVYKEKSESNNELYKIESSLVYSSESAVKTLMVGVKEGLIAGNIEKGFNIGTAYSTAQKPLSDVMTLEEGDKGKFFKFKTDRTIQAALEYFMCPLFGKISISELPKTDKEWNAKEKDINALIDGKGIEINSEYLSFINGTSPELEGIYDTGELKFTNGVKAYKTGVKTQEPLQKVNYLMRVAVPYLFKYKSEGSYALDVSKLNVLSDIRMSVYNDVIYQKDEEGVFQKVCTAADLDLSRNNIAFFNTSEGTEKVGVVILLRFDEAVVVPSEGIFLTGRRVGFDGNYSSTLDINEGNKSIMYSESVTSEKQAIIPRYFTFPNTLTPDSEEKKEEKTDSANPTITGVEVDGSSVYKVGDSHTEVTGDEKSLVMYVGFEQITIMNDNDETGEDLKDFWRFVIVRNNSIIGEDGKLMNWLASKEAKSTPFVFAEDLRKKIRGEFSASMLDYEDWKQMQEIKSQLDNNKNSILPHILNVVSIVFGVFLIFFGIFLALAYWFDIFNAFSDFSILYWLSSKRMYPVTSDDTIQYGPTNDGETKFVNFWQVLKITFSCWLIGFVFLNSQELFYRFLWLYQYIMSKLGG